MRRLWLLAALGAATPTFAQNGAHDPPPPPPAPSAVPAERSVAPEDYESPQLQRYQACFQKMIDAGASDNSYMRKCLGLSERAKMPAGAAAPLTREEVASGLKAATPDVKKCYERLLASWKDLGKKPQGDLAFSFNVARGVTSDVAFESGPSDTALVSCVGARLKTLAFRKAETEPARVTAHWTLAPLSKGGKGGTAELVDKAVVVGGPAYGLTHDEILGVFNKNAARLRQCYEDLLKKSPNAGGRLAISLFVTEKGRVAKVSFRELTVEGDSFKACAIKELKSWRFPRPRSGEAVPVVYPPLELKPR